MKQVIAILGLVLMMSSAANAKVFLIYIKRTLDEASTIRMIKVVDYSDSVMFYTWLNSKDTLQADCRRRHTSELTRQFNVVGRPIKVRGLAGKWPDVGEKVLLVLKNDNVMLFAKKMGEKYRFWDPNSVPMANTVFVVPDEKPFIPLDDIIDWGNPHPGLLFCEDGCYAIARDIKEKG